MNLLDRLKTRGNGGERDISTLEDYAQLYNQYLYSGLGYGFSTPTIVQTLAGGKAAELAPNNFTGLAEAGYLGNPVVFACMAVRQLVFSSIRFRWQRVRDGKPSEMFTDPQLRILEQPWPGGSTQDLLSRMIQDADIAGNSYWTLQGGELVRLRPDWVNIVVDERRMPDGRGQIGWELAGYTYTERGQQSGEPTVGLLPNEVVHFCPHPDPLAVFRGMSWLTPILREISADHAMTQHERKFFENGAPQPIDAKILTPAGWSTMGEMRVGSRVIGSDGKPRDVVAVYPQGEQDIYRVTFSGGASTECTLDHLWSVASAYDRRLGVTRTMSLAQIVENGVCYQSGPSKWSVPLVGPVNFDEVAPLPIHPYLLGSLLGDGSMRGNSGVRIARRDRGGWAEFNFARMFGGGRSNALTEQLRELGLWRKLGHEKFVPEHYMRASISDRVALLQGLLDTDGSVEKGQPNTVTFSSTSRQLAQQVAELAASLGGIAKTRASRPPRGTSRAQWLTRISRLPEGITPFRLTRKASTYRPTLRGGAYRYIRNIEYVGRKPAQCIGVDSHDHLYVTDDYLLTHNTPNMVVKHAVGTDQEKLTKFAEVMDAKFGGAGNAYKTLHLYPGADVSVVGANMRQIDFTSIRNGGEARIAAAAGIPPVIAGLTPGLESATYSNYAQARRRLADGTAHPLWQNLSGSLQNLFTPPRQARGDVRLWYDATDVPFLREDEADAANIASVKAATIASYITAGFTADSAVSAVEADDLGLLTHTNLFSVQLQPPGAQQSQNGVAPQHDNPAMMSPQGGSPNGQQQSA